MPAISVPAVFLDLVKPKIVAMVVVTTSIGYFLAGGASNHLGLFFLTIIGNALACAGSCALNNYLERDIDAKMQRTRNRPLPRGAIEATDALIYGIILVLCGVGILVWKVNLLIGFITLLTAFLYVLVYTPLKQVTWWNTFIGAVPGALPPVGGWAAATGSLDTGAWLLFLILFIWQHPHFYAIAWLYRDDYKRGGFKMLPVVDESGQSTFRQTLYYSILLIPISILPSFWGISGVAYGIGALALSVYMFSSGLGFYQAGHDVAARKLVIASVIYLPALFFLIIIDGAIQLLL